MQVRVGREGWVGVGLGNEEKDGEAAFVPGSLSNTVQRKCPALRVRNHSLVRTCSTRASAHHVARHMTVVCVAIMSMWGAS